MSKFVNLYGIVDLPNLLDRELIKSLSSCLVGNGILPYLVVSQCKELVLPVFVCTNMFARELFEHVQVIPALLFILFLTYVLERLAPLYQLLAELGGQHAVLFQLLNI